MVELPDMASMHGNITSPLLRDFASKIRDLKFSISQNIGSGYYQKEITTAEGLINDLIQGLATNVAMFAEDVNTDRGLELQASIDSLRGQLKQWVEAPPIPNLSTIYSASIFEILDQTRMIIHEAVGQLHFSEIPEKPTLPSERSAPVQVEIRNNVVNLISTQTKRGDIDYSSADRIRDSLSNSLREIIDDLPSSSNVDRRYLRACNNLLDHLSQPMGHVSIETLGLQYQLVNKMTKAVAEEIGSAMLVEIQHVLDNVSVLLNQFEEWRNYLSEFEKTKLDPGDPEGLIHRGQQLIAELEKPDVPVDPTVISRLKEMIEPAVSGIVSADTIAVPLVCSLSNFFSLLSSVAIDHYQSLSASTGHTAVAGAAFILVRFSADMIELFCPVLSKYQPLKFIIGVANYLSKLYSQLKDATIHQ